MVTSVVEIDEAKSYLIMEIDEAKSWSWLLQFSKPTSKLIMEIDEAKSWSWLLQFLYNLHKLSWLLSRTHHLKIQFTHVIYMLRPDSQPSLFRSRPAHFEAGRPALKWASRIHDC